MVIDWSFLLFCAAIVIFCGLAMAATVLILIDQKNVYDMLLSPKKIEPY